MRILPTSLLLAAGAAAHAQTIFDEEIALPPGFVATEVVLPPSPLTTQVLFVGGVDVVESPATYGNPIGKAVAKEWHDFIGFTPDDASDDLGWVSVNHEQIYRDDRLGDGGGMTVFKVRRAGDGTLEVVDQQLGDGRAGKFFGVDFASVVGETGMNCGGISSRVDGRIWTAEEWFRSSNASINDGRFSDQFEAESGFPKAPGSRDNQGVRDTSDFTIDAPEFPEFDGRTLRKYENFNYMVEVDPREARAIRKQYNWGRQPFEGGAIESSNQIVYLGPDATPGFFGMFVAETPGDFTRGTLFAYKHDKEGFNWVPIWGADDLLDQQAVAAAKGATMFNRIEWVAIDNETNNVYFTETGRDRPGSRFARGEAAGAVHDPYHLRRAARLGLESPNSPDYPDLYGRIWRYDPVADTLTVYLEGGPDLAEGPAEADYPDQHLSNPDGLNVMEIDGVQFLVIQEDLNGTSGGRVPSGVDNRTCEVYLLDLRLDEPTLDDLIRLTAVPAGAEVTGAMPTPDGKSLLVNVQHPNATNPFPFNHSLTLAIHGFDQVSVGAPRRENAGGGAADADADAGEAGATGPAGTRPFDLYDDVAEAEAFGVYPNPTMRTIALSGGPQDVALYDATGARVLVRRGVTSVDVSHLAAGNYLVRNGAGETVRLVVQ